MTCKCKHHPVELDNDHARAAYAMMRSVAENPGLSRFPAMRTMMQTFDALLTRFDKLHVAYHEDVDAAHANVAMLIEMIKSLPGGEHMLMHFRWSHYYPTLVALPSGDLQRVVTEASA